MLSVRYLRKLQHCSKFRIGYKISKLTTAFLINHKLVAYTAHVDFKAPDTFDVSGF